MDSALDNRTHIFVGDLPQARLLTAGYCECGVVLQKRSIRRFVITEKAPARAFSYVVESGYYRFHI